LTSCRRDENAIASSGAFEHDRYNCKIDYVNCILKYENKDLPHQEAAQVLTSTFVLEQLAELHDVEAFYCDPSEPGLMAQLVRGLAGHKSFHQDCKLRASVQPATNDVLPGLSAVDKALRAGMTISPSCEQLLTEIPGYTWKPERGGGFAEKPIEVNDDACDALRYAVMAFEPNKSNPWAALSSGQAGGVA
jgi:hypothetical protein